MSTGTPLSPTPPTAATPIQMLGELTHAVIGQGSVTPDFATPQDQWTWCLSQIGDLRLALSQTRNALELQGGEINEQRLVELREALQMSEYGDHGRWVWSELTEKVAELRTAYGQLLEVAARDEARQAVPPADPRPTWGKKEIVERIFDLSREIMFDADTVDNPLGYNMRALARGLDNLAADIDGGVDFGHMLERLVFATLLDRPEPNEDAPLTEGEIDAAHAGAVLAFGIEERIDSDPENRDLRKAAYDVLKEQGLPMVPELEAEFGNKTEKVVQDEYGILKIEELMEQAVQQERLYHPDRDRVMSARRGDVLNLNFGMAHRVRDGWQLEYTASKRTWTGSRKQVKRKLFLTDLDASTLGLIHMEQYR